MPRLSCLFCSCHWCVPLGMNPSPNPIIRKCHMRSTCRHDAHPGVELIRMGASILQYITAFERFLQTVIPIFTIIKVVAGLVVAGGGLWLMEAILIPKDEYKKGRDQTMEELKQLEAKLEIWSKMTEEEKKEHLEKEEENDQRKRLGGLTHNPFGGEDGDDPEVEAT